MDVVAPEYPRRHQSMRPQFGRMHQGPWHAINRQEWALCGARAPRGWFETAREISDDADWCLACIAAMLRPHTKTT